MEGRAVTIKGTSDGLVIALGEGPLDVIVSEMGAQLDAGASFFVGGRVALRVGDRSLTGEQLQAIGAALERSGVTLWAVQCEHPATYAAAQELGLETSPHPPALAAPEDSPSEEMSGIVVRRTLHSGQALHHAGHITLIGDLNPGAELVAAGDLIVWGKLRGTAHAGAMGDEKAIICALQLMPNQIRIGPHIARPPELGHAPTVPEIARVCEGGIVVEHWNLPGRRMFGIEGWRWRLKALFGRSGSAGQQGSAPERRA